MTDVPPAGLTHLHSGKVRDLYRTDDGLLVMVASDRMSAFDYILATPIPDKGRILTALSVWWFERLGVPNHLLAVDDPRIPAHWLGRAIICKPLEMVPVECVARGYLAGSGWGEYRVDGTICGVPLPDGLLDGSRLPEPIFTPATKAVIGEHDENVTFEHVVNQVGETTAEQLRRQTLDVYAAAAAIAEERGVILADTKFEFGFDPATGELLLGDEVLTPDSSRFWPADRWQPGGAQPSFDKQYVRDWLTSAACGWDRASGALPPALPDEVAEATRARYVEAYERITGLAFADWLGADSVSR